MMTSGVRTKLLIIPGQGAWRNAVYFSVVSSCRLLSL